MNDFADLFLGLMLGAVITVLLMADYGHEGTGTIICTHPADPTTAYLVANGEYAIANDRIKITDQNGRMSDLPAGDCYVTGVEE